MPNHNITCKNCKSERSTVIHHYGDVYIPICDYGSELLICLGETTEPLEGCKYANIEDDSSLGFIIKQLREKISNISPIQKFCDLPVEKNGNLLLKKQEKNEYSSANLTIDEIGNELLFNYDAHGSSRDQSFNLADIYIYSSEPPDKILHIWVHDHRSEREKEKEKWTSFFLKSSKEQDSDDWFFTIYSAKCKNLDRHLNEIKCMNMDLWRQIFVTFSHEYVKQGWLYKSRPNSEGMDNKRWVVLLINYILYFKEPFDSQPKNVILITGRRKSISVETKSSSETDEVHCFTLKVPDRTYTFTSKGSDKGNNRDSWVKSIKKCLDAKLK